MFLGIRNILWAGCYILQLVSEIYLCIRKYFSNLPFKCKCSPIKYVLRYPKQWFQILFKWCYWLHIFFWYSDTWMLYLIKLRISQFLLPFRFRFLKRVFFSVETSKKLNRRELKKSFPSKELLEIETRSLLPSLSYRHCTYSFSNNVVWKSAHFAF